MMNLIERLRCFGGTTPKIQKQAADELERAEAVIEAVRSKISYHNPDMPQEAIWALQAYDKGKAVAVQNRVAR